MARRSDQDVEAGLKALVLHAGNYRLAAEDCKIPKDTLKDWRQKTYRDRYEALRKSHEETVDREIGEDLLNILKRITTNVGTTLDAYESSMKTGDYKEARDAANAIKALMVAGGVSNQNSRIIREKPTSIDEHRYDIGQLDAAMEAIALEAQVIDVESRELVPGKED